MREVSRWSDRQRSLIEKHGVASTFHRADVMPSYEAALARSAIELGESFDGERYRARDPPSAVHDVADAKLSRDLYESSGASPATWDIVKRGFAPHDVPRTAEWRRSGRFGRVTYAPVEVLGHGTREAIQASLHPGALFH